MELYGFSEYIVYRGKKNRLGHECVPNNDDEDAESEQDDNFVPAEVLPRDELPKPPPDERLRTWLWHVFEFIDPFMGYKGTVLCIALILTYIILRFGNMLLKGDEGLGMISDSDRFHYWTESLLHTGSEDFRPRDLEYFGYKGPWIEEYFFDRHVRRNTGGVLRYHWRYLPIFWSAMAFGKSVTSTEEKKARGRAINKFIRKFILKQHVYISFKEPFFTVVQADSAFDLLGIELPANVVAFDAAGFLRGGQPHTFIAIPLILGERTPSLPPFEATKTILVSSTLRSFDKGKKVRKTLLKKLSFVDYNEIQRSLKNETEEIQRVFMDPHSIVHYVGPEYQEFLERSIFTLCPRGAGRTSFRLYEALQLGTIPIYIWDDLEWLPFKDAVDFKWSDIGLSLNINDIERLPQMLAVITHKEILQMQQNIWRLRHHFTLSGVSNYIEHKIYNNTIRMYNETEVESPHKPVRSYLSGI